MPYVPSAALGFRRQIKPKLRAVSANGMLRMLQPRQGLKLARRTNDKLNYHDCCDEYPTSELGQSRRFGDVAFMSANP